jgi:hypothetical protein
MVSVVGIALLFVSCLCFETWSFPVTEADLELVILLPHELVILPNAGITLLLQMRKLLRLREAAIWLKSHGRDRPDSSPGRMVTKPVFESPYSIITHAETHS